MTTTAPRPIGQLVRVRVCGQQRVLSDSSASVMPRDEFGSDFTVDAAALEVIGVDHSREFAEGPPAEPVEVASTETERHGRAWSARYEELGTGSPRRNNVTVSR